MVNTTKPFAQNRLLNLLFIATFLFITSFAISAQSPRTAATGQTAATQSPGMLKVVSREVVVDVVVTNRKMQPVTGLKAQDFEILEDGAPQRIVSFTAHHLMPSVASGLPKLPALPQGIYTNFDPAPADSPLNVILIDVENTPRLDLPYVREQIVKFLRAQPEESRYAVFAMGGGMLSMVQGFTSDKDKLLQAINSKELSSLIIEQSIDPFTFRGGGRAPEDVLNSLESGAATPWSPAENPDAMSGGSGGLFVAHALVAAEEEFSNRAQVGDAASELARLSAFLRGLPGRKNLLWFTGSFPMGRNNLLDVSNRVRASEGQAQIQTSQKQAGPSPSLDYSAGTGTVVIDNSSAIDRLGRLLAGSRTSVYAIDARGLETVSPKGSAAQAAATEQYAEHVTLDSLAKATGGHAFYNTNGFKEAMASALNEGTDYYTLSYSPTNTDFQGGWRNIRVVLRNHIGPFHLAYERGYFATSTNGLGEAALNSLDFTLQHGAPSAQQILFWAFVAPVGAPFVPVARSAQAAHPPTGAGGKGRSKSRPDEMQRYLVRYAVTPSMIHFEKAGSGGYTAKLEFDVRGYDGAGRETGNYAGRSGGEISQAAYETIKQKGLLLSQAVVLPATTAWLRLAVYDSLSRRVGSLEVPLTPPSRHKNPKSPSPSAP